MNNALTYFGGFLVVVFAALFAVPALIDWNGYRGVFEEEASKVLGRDVRVNGGVNLRLMSDLKRFALRTPQAKPVNLLSAPKALRCGSQSRRCCAVCLKPTKSNSTNHS
jgi:uncharacterized protein involved in outer membrane biogenesis